MPTPPDPFAKLAQQHTLCDVAQRSPDDLPERYLYSHDMVHRYAFGRWWGAEDIATSDVWVLLNPATGDTELRHRPTLARCIARSRADGATGLVIVNLFAYRDTDPKGLRTATDPVGGHNDDVLRTLTRQGRRTLVAWGSHGGLFDRSQVVAPLLDVPVCLGTTRRGQPRHPLYVRADAQPVPWVPPGTAPAQEGDDGAAKATDSGTDRATVEREIARVKDFVTGLSLDDIRRGDWFAQLLTFSLDRYARDVDAAYFREKYPGLPPDAVVRARVQIAARYAAIEGGLSAGAYTTAVAATIGSAGGASPLTLPAGGVSFVVDLVFTSQLQLRLAYDIAVLYGVPLDLDDPEDLWKLIRVALAVQAAETGRGLLGKGIPMAVRPVVKKLYSGSALATGKSLPVIGKYLLQRNVIKFAVPAVGVPISAAVNHWSTKTVGAFATKTFRQEARTVEAARRMTERTAHHAALLWVLWLVITSDGPVHEHETSLLHHVTRMVSDTDPDLPALRDLASTIDVDPRNVWAVLADVGGDLAPLIDAAVVAAAIDGEINDRELDQLQELACRCGVPFDRDQARRGSGTLA